MRSFADAFNALGDESRLKIIKILREGKLPVNELVQRCGLSQQTVSYHLRVLRQVGIALDIREGQRIHYGLNPETFIGLRLFMRYLEKGNGSTSAAMSNSPDET